MISVIAYKTYRKYQSGMTNITDLQTWLKETAREDWPLCLIHRLLTEAKNEI